AALDEAAVLLLLGGEGLDPPDGAHRALRHGPERTLLHARVGGERRDARRADRGFKGANCPSPLPPVCPARLPARCPSVRGHTNGFSPFAPTTRLPGGSTSPPPFRNDGCSNPCAKSSKRGLHFRDHVVLLALGVDFQGQKHVLALREGTTENATVCKSLLTDLHERGLALERAVLFVIDGGTGLRKAIRETCGPTAVVQRCQVHKGRNVLEHLPAATPPPL